MCDTLSVAKTLYNMFLLRNGAELNEASMQKFMYLVQRESLLVNRHVLFNEPFYGWKYGPVLYSVQQEYQKSDKFSAVEEEKNCEVRNLLLCVLERYEDESLWNLSEMIHGELAWRFARFGLGAAENGNVPLSLRLMQTDANRELAFRRTAK